MLVVADAAVGSAQGFGPGVHRDGAGHAHYVAGWPGGNSGHYAGNRRCVLRVRYVLAGRMAAPKHRILVFSADSSFSFSEQSPMLCSSTPLGVLIFIGCLLLAKPLLDLAYYPIQLQVVDVVSRIEGRNEYAYIFNHEFGLFLGRWPGMLLIPGHCVLGVWCAALKYALPVIALLQLFSIRVAGQILRGLAATGNSTSPVVSHTVTTMEA